jgi:diguanylate cyclase
MRKRLDEANAMAQSDQLTGLPNRWAFEQQFTAATIRSKEKFEPLAVAFLDIDHFKQVNDTHGHEAGDRVLQLVAKHLNSFTNGNCHLARHGGEEFVLVFEGMNASEAKILLDDAREKLAVKSLKNKETGETIGQVTFSGGIANFRPSEPNRQVLRNADAALYRAKHEGRNQILVFESN